MSDTTPTEDADVPLIIAGSSQAAVALRDCRHIVFRGIRFDGGGVAPGLAAYTSPGCLPAGCTFTACTEAPVGFPIGMAPKSRQKVLRHNSLGEDARPGAVSGLPPWCAGVGYGIALFLILAAAIFALFFTAGYTDEAAGEWSINVVASLIMDALLIKPITGALSAIALAWIRLKSKGGGGTQDSGANTGGQDAADPAR